VCGSLEVGGLYRDYDNPATAVYVLGEMTAARAITNGTLGVGKNLVVRETLVGFYNDHSAEILGSVTAGAFAPENHHFAIGGKLAVEVVLGSGAEYRVSTRHKKAVKALVDKVPRDRLVPEIVRGGDDDPDSELDLDHSALRDRVAAGKPILVATKPKQISRRRARTTRS
jgi:hypothetical protein